MNQKRRKSPCHGGEFFWLSSEMSEYQIHDVSLHTSWGYCGSWGECDLLALVLKFDFPKQERTGFVRRGMFCFKVAYCSFPNGMECEPSNEMEVCKYCGYCPS